MNTVQALANLLSLLNIVLVSRLEGEGALCIANEQQDGFTYYTRFLEVETSKKAREDSDVAHSGSINGPHCVSCSAN